MSRTLRVRSLAVGAITLAMTTFAACAPPPPADGSSTAPSAQTSGSAGGGWQGKSVTVWLAQKPDTMSPFSPGALGNGQVLTAVHDSLAAVTADGKLVPRVAESWKMSQDAKQLTINLANQKWSDGSAFTADDVVFSLNLYANPKSKAPLTSVLSPIVGFAEVAGGTATTMTGVKKVDDRTVTIDLKSPDSGFTYLFLGTQVSILPKAVLEKEDPASLQTSAIWTTPGKVPGLGPFVMSNVVTGQRVEFTRNPNFRQPVKFEKLVQSMVTQDVATSQLASGEMDLTLVAPTDLKAVQSMNGVKTLDADSTGFDRYSVPQNKDYLKNPKVRQGLLTAIDRKGIIASVYAGQATPVNTSFTSPTIKTDGFATYDYDPAKAKQLLTEGGWDFNRELVIKQANNNKQREDINAVVAKNLQAAGVKVKVVTYDNAQGTEILTKFDYDLLLYGGGNYLVDPSLNAPILLCANAFPKGANLPNYCNPELDKQMAAASATADEAKRTEAFNAAAKIDNADVSHLWVARPKRTYGTSSKITGGVKPGEAIVTVLYSVQDWTVK